MSSFASLINKRNVSTGFQGVETDPSGFTDVVTSSFYMTKHNFNTNSKQALEQEIIEENNKKLKELNLLIEENKFEGMSFSELGVLPRSIPRSNTFRPPEDTVILEGRKTDFDTWSQVLTTEEIQEEARRRANLSREEDDLVKRNASSFDRTVGGFIGGLGAAFTDPLNIATAFIGAGASRSILQTAAIEAGLNAGVEAATQPLVAKWQKELGQDYGFDEAAINVITAGVFGGVAGGVLRGAQATSRTVLERIRSNKETPAKAKQAAEQLEAYIHIREADPAPVGRREDIDVHYDNVKKTSEFMDSGSVVRSEDLQIDVIDPFDNTEKGFFDFPDYFKESDITDLQAQQKSIIDSISEELKITSGDLLDDDTFVNLREAKRNLLIQKQGIKVSSGKTPEEKSNLLSEYQRVSKEIEDINTSLSKHRKAKIDQNNLNLLNDGIVPSQYVERYNDAFNTIDNRARLADKKINPTTKPQIKEQQTVQKEMLDQGVLREEIIPQNVYDELTQEALSDETFRGIETNFNRSVEEFPDRVISLDDGRDITLRELAEEFELDENFLSQATSCATG